MIEIQKMKFSNVLSYGEDNEIVFNGASVTQLVGKNGHGKSSIATILEEALYNKNSRGIAKKDLVNRNTDSGKYFIEVTFIKDGVEHVVTKNVATTAKVDLTIGEEILSGHTATQTYKIIEEIIGADFTTFTKLVNQSMKSSLDFLTSTDSVRKKFLIDLIGLDEYVEAEKKVKTELKLVNDKLTEIKGARSFIEREIISTKPIAEKPMQEVPELPDYSDENTQLKVRALTLEQEVVDLAANNAKIEARNLQVSKVLAMPDLVEMEILPETSKDEEATLAAEISAAEATKTKMRQVKTECYTCHRPFDDVPDMSKDIAELQKTIDSQKESLKALKEERARIESHNSKAKLNNSRLKAKLEEIDKLGGDLTMQETVKIENLKQERKEILKAIEDLKLKSIAEQARYNEAVRHNALVEISIKKLAELQDSISKYETEGLPEALGELGILKDTFGNKGLVAYKIESSIKVFEKLINEYLVQLSQGQFALQFKVTESKLEVELYDNGTPISIKSVSSGELNKINMSTLLAFRKLMSAVSKVNINLLFIDEVSSVLDGESRDELTELLLRERHLNSLMVTHEYTHPLTSKLNVIKENQISRIELGN